MYRISLCQVILCVICISSGTVNGQSPGGVRKESVWLRGNFFSDSSAAASFNFNPAFAPNRQMTLKMPANVGDLRRGTVFTVYQNTVNENKPVWEIRGRFGDFSMSTQEVASESENMQLIFKKPEANRPVDARPSAFISTYIRQQSAGKSQGNYGTASIINFGSQSSSKNSSGSIAEFILYETILKEKQISRIESYLAIKYGITLEKNYVNSNGKTIWDRKAYEMYSNNIAGIGRDDQSALYQKQSTSSSTDDHLAIGLNSIAASNSDNNGVLEDGSYLLWGDNNRPFVFDKQQAQSTTSVLLSEKKWVMSVPGKAFGNVPTELLIDTKKLLPVELPSGSFCLAIDRSGSGNFTSKNCEYILPVDISEDGIAIFKGVRWDTDGSGTDAFSFGLKTGLDTDARYPVKIQVYPNPLTDGRYSVSVKLDKPADIKVRLYDIHLHLIESKNVSGQSSYLVPGVINGAGGVYIVKVFAGDKEYSQIIIRP